MSWTKKEKVKIINSGGHLPEGTIESELRFLADSERFVGEQVRMQSIKDGAVIYGAQAVNAIVGPMHSRPTSDYDVYSAIPKDHAIQLEKAIDTKAKADIAHVEEVGFINEKGKSGKMYRVGLKNFNTVADYNKLPKNIKVVNIKGVKYEALDRAEKKYVKMINDGETKRLINANEDLTRIHLFKHTRRLF